MPQPPVHYIYVCTTCHQGEGKKQIPVPNRDGFALLNRVRALVKGQGLQAEFKVRGVRCMGGCKEACSVGFAAEGKQSCLFTQLSPTAPEDVLEIAQVHQKSRIGRVKCPALPERLKPNYLCRIPQAPRQPKPE